MKIQKMIEGLEKVEKDCADNIQQYYHQDHHEKYHSLSSAIAFIKAYQERVKELEEAIENANKAKQFLINCGYEAFSKTKIGEELDILNVMLDTLNSFYEYRENPFEALAEAVSSLRVFTQGMEEACGDKCGCGCGFCTN